MAQNPIIPMILSGGAGVRLWPLSRAAKPKQFLSFGGEHSLIQSTVLRCSGPLFDRRPIVVSGESQRFLVAEDLRAIDVSADIVLEPMRRDSCAAIAVGCLVALRRSPDALVLILAADHLIADVKLFAAAVEAARIEAEQGYLTTFGIRPTKPATGFGYIKPGEALRPDGSFAIERFVEKPNADVARQYMRDGYLWNSGNFLFKAAVFLQELGTYAPEVLAAATRAVDRSVRDQDFWRLDEAGFAQSPQISVDYAVMEKTQRAAVYPVSYGWNDIGSWDAVYEILEKDVNANAVIGTGLVHSGSGNLVYSVGPATAVVGVDDVIVVSTADAVLVTKAGQSEKLKALIAEMKSRNLKQAD